MAAGLSVGSLVFIMAVGLRLIAVRGCATMLCRNKRRFTLSIAMISLVVGKVLDLFSGCCRYTVKSEG